MPRGWPRRGALRAAGPSLVTLGPSTSGAVRGQDPPRHSSSREPANQARKIVDEEIDASPCLHNDGRACWRHRDWPGPARGDTRARCGGAALGNREGASIDCRRRAQGDDADARRRPVGDRHLPPEGCVDQGADRLGADALQLQLLGRAQRRAERPDGGADCSEAGLRVRCPERARPFLLGGQLRHPRPAAPTATTRSSGCRSSRGRTARSGRSGVRRPPNIRWASRRSGIRVCGDERAGFRRRRRSGRTVFRARQLVPRRRRADAFHYLDLRPAEPGSADVSARHVAGRS